VPVIGTLPNFREGAGNVGYGGIRNPRHNRKGACRSLSTYGCARLCSTRPSLVVYPHASEVTDASGLTGSPPLRGAMRPSARGETTAQERRPLAQAACFPAGLAARRPGAATLRH